MSMESWDKKKVMSLNNNDLLVYINHMLASGWSLGRLNKEKGIRRQTVRDRLKKDGYVFNHDANAFIKPLIPGEDLQISSVKPIEKPRNVQKQESDVLTLESLQRRIEALEMRINTMQVSSKADTTDFELIKFNSKEQPRNYPLYQEVVDLLADVHSNNRHLKVKDIVNHALYTGLVQMKHSKSIE